MADGRSEGAADRGDGRGLLALLGAFTLWGLLPLYLRALQSVPALQILAYRAVLCCAVVLGFLALRGEFGQVRQALVHRATRGRLALSALLISINWLVFVWAVQSGRVIESSLGYFINPLVNVALGVMLLRERLSRLQQAAVAIAALGVAYLTWQARALPWIALVLAFSFGLYGLVRKTVAVEAMAGLGSETLLIAPFGVGYLAIAQAGGAGAIGRVSPGVVVVLLLSGVVTAVPLWLFSYGARRVPYSTVGIIQYVGPSLQLMTGLFVFHEPFDPSRAVGFALIWAALALYAADGLLHRRASG